MARRSEHTQEEIRAMVLKAAETIVVEEGFAELKVRKIAMDIGYTVGSIYMVFDNMADLIIHVKGGTLDDLTEQLKKAITDEGAEQAIQKLAKAYLNFATQNFNRWWMIFDHQAAGNDPIPEWYQHKVDIIFALVESQFIRLAADQNNLQRRVAARTLWSGVHGICTLSLTGKLDLLGGDNIENSVDLLVDSFIKGWTQA